MDGVSNYSSFSQERVVNEQQKAPPVSVSSPSFGVWRVCTRLNSGSIYSLQQQKKKNTHPSLPPATNLMRLRPQRVVLSQSSRLTSGDYGSGGKWKYLAGKSQRGRCRQYPQQSLSHYPLYHAPVQGGKGTERRRVRAGCDRVVVCVGVGEGGVEGWREGGRRQE